MTLRVLQLGPYPPPEGGVTRNMLAIRDRLLQRGDECSMIATSRSARVIDEPRVYHPRSAVKLVSLIRKIDHDILHLHVGGEIDRRVLSLMVAATAFGRRPILTMHSGGYATTKAALRAKPNSARGRIFRRFSHVIAVNDELANVFKRYGLSDGTVSTILPFALSPPDPNIELRPEIKEFCDSHSPLIVSVGGLEPDYQPLFLVKTMKEIRRSHPDAGLVIAGGGSLLNEVERAVALEDLKDTVLLAGDVLHGETLLLIATADVMLRITLFDGDSISVREALFVGTPVVATDNGMRPAGVRLIQQGETDKLVSQIGEIVRDPQPRPKELRPDYSNIDDVLALYDSLI